MLARTLAAMAVACFLLAQSNAAAGYTGNFLAEQCGKTMKTEPDYGAGFCMGYVSAMADLAAALGTCIPEDDVVYGQLVKITIKFLNENPERLHLPAGVLISDALRKAFPCPKDDSPKKD